MQCIRKMLFETVTEYNKFTSRYSAPATLHEAVLVQLGSSLLYTPIRETTRIELCAWSGSYIKNVTVNSSSIKHLIQLHPQLKPTRILSQSIYEPWLAFYRFQPLKLRHPSSKQEADFNFQTSIGTGYDLQNSVFSPDGRNFQVEYAVKAVENGGTSIGIRCKDGVVLAVEKLVTSKLLKAGANQRIATIDRHMGAVCTSKRMPFSKSMDG